MAYILIVDDEPLIRKTWVNYLRSLGHQYQEAGDVDSALTAIENSEKTGDIFDLILLDHDLGDEKGLDLIQDIDPESYQYKIIIITGHAHTSIAKDYAKAGAVGHLIKPVSEAQFHNTIESALERQALYLDQREDWQHACELLESMGILESVESLKNDSQRLTEQYEALRQIHESLLDDIRKAGAKEQAIAEAYQKASEALNATPGGIEEIVPLLKAFKITSSLWDDLKYTFSSDRLHFFILQHYLKRIAENPLEYRIKHLTGGANGHYEYRIGRSYRLYFRKDGNTIILERFGHKNIQDKIVGFLGGNCEPILAFGD